MIVESMTMRDLLLYSDLQLRTLKSSLFWLLYAILKSVPSHLSQLFTIHRKFLSKYIPCFHTLMKKKTENSYKNVFLFLKMTINQFPYYIITNFEKELINGTVSVFRLSHINGCNFHFCQMIWSDIENF